MFSLFCWRDKENRTWASWILLAQITCFLHTSSLFYQSHFGRNRVILWLLFPGGIWKVLHIIPSIRYLLRRNLQIMFAKISFCKKGPLGLVLICFAPLVERGLWAEEEESSIWTLTAATPASAHSVVFPPARRTNSWPHSNVCIASCKSLIWWPMACCIPRPPIVQSLVLPSVQSCALQSVQVLPNRFLPPAPSLHTSCSLRPR